MRWILISEILDSNGRGLLLCYDAFPASRMKVKQNQFYALLAYPVIPKQN